MAGSAGDSSSDMDSDTLERVMADLDKTPSPATSAPASPRAGLAAAASARATAGAPAAAGVRGRSLVAALHPLSPVAGTRGEGPSVSDTLQSSWLEIACFVTN
jgi:hypothetical protein